MVAFVVVADSTDPRLADRRGKPGALGLDSSADFAKHVAIVVILDNLNQHWIGRDTVGDNFQVPHSTRWYVGTVEKRRNEEAASLHSHRGMVMGSAVINHWLEAAIVSDTNQGIVGGRLVLITESGALGHAIELQT